VLCRTRADALPSELLHCFCDISDPQAQACISIVRKRLSVGRRHKLEQHPIDIEASHNIARNKLKAQDVLVEADTSV
jgi:hypothetical protein